ncbi:MAG: hypothetical protein H0U54_04335 [Acidobacteria bacterium]|nr:hypothetical protein [Acidobacteriota bacterium]
MKIKIRFIVATLTIASILLLTISQSALAAPVALRVAGMWRSGDGSKQVLVGGLPTSEFIAKRNQLSQQGLAISSIAVYRANGQDNFIAVFEPTPNNKTVTNLLAGTWEQFAAKDKEMFDKGFRLADIALSMDPKNARKVLYTGIWKGGLGNGAQWTDPAMSWEDFLAKAKERFNAGLRPVSMASIAVLDNVQEGSFKSLFTATWRNGLGNGALYFIPPSEGQAYTPALMKHFNDGLRTVAFNTYTVNGQKPMYVGVVSGGLGTPGEWSSPSMKWDEFVAEHNKRVSQGFRLMDVSAYMQFTKID